MDRSTPGNDVGVLTRIDTRRESITTEVARELLAYLLAGDVRPGDKLPSERVLANTLGVGRSVVREALKSLTLLGLVEVRQGSGTFLRSTESDVLPHAIEWSLMLGTKRTQDLVEARRHIEVIVAGLAAQRRDDSDLGEIHVELERMKRAEGDPEAFVAADVAFHLRVAECARNETLFQVMRSIRSLLQAWISRVMHLEDARFAATAAEHEPIYLAIADGDATRARAAMEAHMDSAYARLEASVPSDDGVGRGAT